MINPTSSISEIIRDLDTKSYSHTELTEFFLDRIEKLFIRKGLQTKRYKKPTFARPAPISLIQQITTEVNVVVQGLAD